ncbi:ThiF family adenylyltransferase [Komagataeibacter swingsii]|uniref:ThiF family adenylyltransferase n=1 Tax=Komagataeibacter swingsii TaxID=215220 RepID=A0A850P510_9PROT|nr:ThiF family adenylyltransferase [Komagataeibacter swingsii]
MKDGRLVVQSDTKQMILSGNVPISCCVADRLRDGIPEECFGIDGIFQCLADAGLLCLGKREDRGIYGYFNHFGIQLQDNRDALNNSRILILGLGGTGAVILQHLVGAGVRNFVLVDDDNVDARNLERQFIFHRQQVGQPKTICAAQYIRERNPSASVEIHATRISTPEQTEELLKIVGKIDFAAICIDTPPEQVLANTASVFWTLSIPSIIGGLLISSGCYGPVFDPTRSRTGPNGFRRNYTPSEEFVPGEPVRIAFPPFNTMVGALMASDILHHLAGLHDEVDYDHQIAVTFPLLRRTLIDAMVVPRTQEA